MNDGSIRDWPIIDLQVLGGHSWVPVTNSSNCLERSRDYCDPQSPIRKSQQIWLQELLYLIQCKPQLVVHHAR